MNGFELAGRAMKVGHVTERTDGMFGAIGGQGGKYFDTLTRIKTDTR